MRSVHVFAFFLFWQLNELTITGPRWCCSYESW